MNSKKLFDILPDLLTCEIHGDDQCIVKSIELDSRKAKERSLFVAVKGHTSDGHLFIDAAIANGATSVLLQELPENLNDQITYVKVDDAQKALAYIASAFYNHPSRALTLIGITGTNGKSTTATLMYNILNSMGTHCGLLSTIKYACKDFEETATHTTPDAITINRLFRRMLDAGCTHVVMEVSSHALDQKRTEGLSFDIAVFTNLTHDHLGYHGTFLNYINAKKLLFDHLSKDATAIVNEDDPKWEIMTQNCKANIKTFGLQSMSDYRGRILSNSLEGLFLRINDAEFHSRLAGNYNASNLLAVFATMETLGFSSDDFMIELSKLKGVDGRFELIANPKDQVYGVVDYAHTPDALQKILENVKALKRNGQKLITVVGCGGDRDKTKRPIMARIAAKMSDQLILTNDNPRTENPATILDEMESGLDDEAKRKTLRIEDRLQAIKTAGLLGKENAIILVAGKGHEKYQDINGEKLPFDDVKILTATLLKDIKE